MAEPETAAEAAEDKADQGDEDAPVYVFIERRPVRGESPPR